MSRPNDDLPEIITVTACLPGWFARYKSDSSDEALVEPIAAWGVQVEMDNGQHVRSVVALVPEGGGLVPAHDAGNFDEVFFGGGFDDRSAVAEQQVSKILDILASMDGWLERAEADPSYFTRADLSAHRKHLRQIADLLGREG